MTQTALNDRLRLCGDVCVELAGRRLEEAVSGARPRLCLAYLLLHRDRPVRRQELISAVWPDDPPANPEAALTTVLSRLRGALGPVRIEGRAELRLVLPPGARFDVHDATEATARAEELLAHGDAVAASRAAATALEILERELLPGLEADWIEECRRALDDILLRALECRAEAAFRIGGPALGDAERAVRELVRLSPYRESAYVLLMRTLAARGNPAEALTVYEQLRSVLREELGAVPSHDAAELHQRLLNGEAESVAEGERPLSGTLTLLAAELTGAESLSGRVDERAAKATRVTALQLLRDAARTTQARKLLAEGDRHVFAFESSVRALTCATLMQQFIADHASANPERALGVRCGIAVGEAASEQEAAGIAAAGAAGRLCSLAAPGQVLVSDIARSLAEATAHEFAEVQAREGDAAPQAPRAHELRWRPAASEGRAEGADPAGCDVTTLEPPDVAELERVLAASGIDDARLGRRYSVVFAYPGQGVGDLHLELSGCTTQVCAILEEAATLARHGIHVVGISTEPSVPPPGCSEITFPVGVIPQDRLGGVLPAVDRPERRYAARTSFVVFPDRTGLRITGVSDVIAHVRKSLDAVISRRLAAYRDAAVSHLARRPQLRTSAAVRELLTPGADSIAVPRVEVKLDLVSKIAAPDVIASEAGHIDRMNRLLEEAGVEPLFPEIVSISTDEDPAWYLMEAASPVSLDQLLFADRERTELRHDRATLLAEVLERIGRLYDLTFRAELPDVARYHYLGRFRAIPEREDARTTYESLVGNGALDDMLGRPMELEGLTCRSYREQLAFLEANLGRLLEPIGAYIHGDFHLPNMLLDEAGGRIVLIDPRVVWDGHVVGDPGFCDPLYDPATLLQSLHLAAPLQRAIEDGESDLLLDVQGGRGEPLRVAPGILRLHDNPVVAWCVDWVERALPGRLLGQNWRARLHVGTANACLGWLKYERSVRTRAAWLAIFATVLYHLEVGRRCLEEASET